MCGACAMAAAAGASGARAWLQAHGSTWLTPRRLRLATIALMVAAFGVSTVGLSGSTSKLGAARVIAFESLATLLDGAPELPHDPARDPRAPLLVINTSGTTGPTKGAVITNEMLHFNALNVRAAVGVAPGDEVLTNGPLFNT